MTGLKRLMLISTDNGSTDEEADLLNARMGELNDETKEGKK